MTADDVGKLYSDINKDVINRNYHNTYPHLDQTLIYDSAYFIKKGSMAIQIVFKVKDNRKEFYYAPTSHYYSEGEVLKSIRIAKLKSIL